MSESSETSLMIEADGWFLEESMQYILYLYLTVPILPSQSAFSISLICLCHQHP